MPITITFLFLYCFFCLFMLAVGVHIRSPVAVVVSGVMFLIIGIAGAAAGYMEYDGTYNQTYSYACLSCNCNQGCYLGEGTNLTLNSTSQTANYLVANNMVSQGVSMFLSILGVAALVYAGGVYGEVRKN